MNKRLYKIIFNKKRGCMMAVAENTAREGKTAQDSNSAGVQTASAAAWQGGMPMLAGCFVLFSGIGFAQAQITADKSAPANQQASILKHSSGAPLVNIQTPSAKGLSHNRYTQFDVDAKGAVLNNSRTANPNLSKGSAKLILNEIRSSSPSKLGGIISVEGSKADVVIANPSGIQANGGGFKNVGRGILTTGTPQIKDGALQALDIRQGSVTVGAGGWNDAGAAGADYTEILSRAAAVQGKLQANHLTVSTGAQKINLESGEIGNGTAAGTKPAVAIDTAALGSMYAGSITLIANEKGIGVKNAGTLQAARQLVLTSAGKVENSGSIRTTAAATEAAPTYLSIATTDTANNSINGDIYSTAGKIESKGLMVLDAGRDLVISNTAVNQSNAQTASSIVLDADRHLHINKKAAVSNSGSGAISAAAGGNSTINDAKLSGNAVYLAAKGSNNLQNNSQITAKQDLSVLANGHVNANAAHLSSSAGSIHLEAARPVSLADNPAPSHVNISAGSLSAAKNIVALADNDINANTTVKAADAVYLHAGQNLNLTIGAELPAATQTVSLKADGKATVKAAAVKNLNTAKDLSIEAGSIAVDKVNLKAGSGNLNLTALSGDINLAKDSRLNAGQSIEAAALQGNIVSDGLNATATNDRLTLMANGNVDLANSGSNTAKLTAKTGLNLGSVGKGRLKTDNTDLHATAGDIRLLSGAEMILGNGKQQNTLLARNIHAQSNNGALTATNLKLTANSGNLELRSKQDLTLQNVQSSSSHNSIIAADTGKIHLNQVNANAGRHLSISGNNQIWQNQNQTTANLLKANGILSIHSGWWHTANNSQMQGGAVHLKSNGSGITLHGNTTVKAVSNNLLKNDAKLKTLDGDLNLEAKTDINIHAGRSLSADGDFSLKAGGKLTLAGKSGSKGNPTATTSALSAKGEMKLVAGEMDIQAAKVAAGKDLTVATTTGQLNIVGLKNTFGSYISNEQMTQLRKERDNIAQELSSLKAKQAAIENSAEYQKLDEMLVNILEYAHIDPGYLGPIDMMATIERHRLQPANWKAIKAKMWPHRARIDELGNRKTDLEKMLTVLQSPARGHEHQSTQLSGGNVNILSAQGINIEGAKITAAKQASLQAGGLLPAVSAEAAKQGEIRSAINISGLFDTFEYGKDGSDKYAYAIFSKPSEISGKSGVSIIAPNTDNNSRIVVSASELTSDNGKVQIQAYSDILLTAGQGELYTYDKHSYKTGKWYNRKHITEIKETKNAKAEPVMLTAAKGIDIKSGGSIEAYATEFDAPKGTINITAANALKLYAVDEFNYNKLDKHKKSKFLGITYNNGSSSNTMSMKTALPSKLVAESINTKSGWDTLLEGTEFKTTLSGANIQAGVGENARKDAKIILQGIKTTVQKEETSESKSAVWQRMAGSGSVVETLALPKFEGSTPPKLSAPGGYIVDIPKGRLKTEIEKLAKQPEYAYLKQLQLAKDINWNQVQLEYQKWDYKQEGLTGAGAAIIALALAAVTGGAGAAIASSLTGAAVTGASATMANAAFLSLASQASVSLINNKGNLGKTFKELGSSRTVKNLATAVVSAGVADKIGASSALQKSSSPTLNNFTVNLATAGSSAVINTAINGGSLGDNLENAILNALVQTAHGKVASKIKNLDSQYIAHKVAHAVAGCAAAAANKGKCQDGAIGAAVGEIVGERLLNGRKVKDLNPKEYAQIVAYSRLVAGTAAGLTGGDVNVAADAAKVAVENNALKWTSTTPADLQKDSEEKEKQDDWFSILFPAHAASLSKDSQTMDINNFRDRLRNISLTGAVVSGYSPIIVTGGKAYFISAAASITQGAATSVIIEGQSYKVSDLAYDATLGVLMSKRTDKIITWADTDNKAIKTYLYSKGELTNYGLGKGASSAISQVLQDKNTVLIEVPEWRKNK
ncbi:MAG: DUF637 domain-containing protein [Neisseria sp.]|nr:DUF637 domain-containing protein [Neisseria sp.]